MEKCTGVYVGYGIFDRIDFKEIIQTGITLEEYAESRKSPVIRIAYKRGQGGKNRYVPYEFIVDGKKYYGCTNTAYSIDLRARMEGKSVEIEYDPENPYNCKIASSDKAGSVIGSSITAMVLGLISFLISFTVIPPIVLSIISLVFSYKAWKNEESVKGIVIFSLIMAILGILGAAVAFIIYLVLFAMWLLSI